jgi:hypothetical protein
VLAVGIIMGLSALGVNVGAPVALLGGGAPAAFSLTMALGHW